ncbi:hypothetical protein [Membranihabitans marinus]|uniref:hypothetical protein n=1 Tax=Membranihabitans marinus TaxID=1227546 RepID=UPI001F25F209|nr:hypothetical protein [Membranihabitans marinus]
MKNPYKIYLTKFFETITDFKHTSIRLNKILLKDVENYSDDRTTFFSATTLIIQDWTGSFDNGSKLKYHTGVTKTTFREDYANEVHKVLSREFGLYYSQSYEALETLFKDLIYIKINADESFKNSLPKDKNYSRHSLKGGNEVFKLIQKAGKTRFQNYSKNNLTNFKFSETFKIFSEVRHAITHSQGVLKTSKIPNNNYYRSLFEYLLPLNELKGETLILNFDFNTFTRLLGYITEFGYQIFKILSEEDDYEWTL